MEQIEETIAKLKVTVQTGRKKGSKKRWDVVFYR